MDYPIVYLVQDNEWDISAHSSEIRKMDADYYAKGFKGLRVISIDGTDFNECYDTVDKIISLVRKDRKPYLIHVKVPLLKPPYQRRAQRMVQAQRKPGKRRGA